jgi:hypothetical protein
LRTLCPPWERLSASTLFLKEKAVRLCKQNALRFYCQGFQGSEHLPWRRRSTNKVGDLGHRQAGFKGTTIPLDSKATLRFPNQWHRSETNKGIFSSPQSAGNKQQNERKRIHEHNTYGKQSTAHRTEDETCIARSGFIGLGITSFAWLAARAAGGGGATHFSWDLIHVFGSFRQYDQCRWVRFCRRGRWLADNADWFRNLSIHSRSMERRRRRWGGNLGDVRQHRRLHRYRHVHCDRARQFRRRRPPMVCRRPP